MREKERKMTGEDRYLSKLHFQPEQPAIVGKRATLRIQKLAWNRQLPQRPGGLNELWMMRQISDCLFRKAFLVLDGIQDLCELPILATENILMDAVKRDGNRQRLHERIRELFMEQIEHFFADVISPI